MGRVRFQCRDCARRGRGGFFSLSPREAEGEVRCPYCGSKRVKRLSK